MNPSCTSCTSCTVPFVVLTLECLRVAEVRGLLREAYMTGGAVFGELRRGVNPGAPGDVVLIMGVADKATAKKIQRLLAPQAVE